MFHIVRRILGPYCPVEGFGSVVGGIFLALDKKKRKVVGFGENRIIPIKG